MPDLQIKHTALMPATLEATPTLVASLSSNVILAWDIETRRMKRQLLGHMWVGCMWAGHMWMGCMWVGYFRGVVMVHVVYVSSGVMSGTGRGV